jgi:hypothetical protein
VSDRDDGEDQENPPASTSGFDRYRGLLDPAIMIFVAKDARSTGRRPNASRPHRAP